MRTVDSNAPEAVTIRAGEAADAESISILILELAERFVLPEFSAEGRERFSTAHAPAAIAALMESGYRYHVAECGGAIVGVVGICGPSHLYHLFVAADMHGRGLGRRLWEVARVDWPASKRPLTWTVKASRYAVPVYERFGFVATGPLQAKGGILTVPMELREPGDERVTTGEQAMLCFLCGKMAAGKSTHARRLAGSRRAVLLVLDEFLAALYPGQVKSITDFVEYSARVRRALSPHIRALLSRGVSVVLDFPGNTRTQRQWFRELIDAAQVGHELHFLDAADELCKRQLRARSAALPPGTAWTTDAEFDAITAHFQAPSDDEGFNVVRHECA